MKSLVVYESLFGNTEVVAAAIVEGLACCGEARALTTDGAAALGLADVDLLVVGAPTHAWGMPRERTWVTKPGARPAVTRSGQLVRGWLAALPAGGGRPAAAFTTRIGKPAILTGSAARGIAKQLRHHGWAQAAAPASFVVGASEGPLTAGEVERARAWGESLARAADRATSAR